MKIDIIKNIFTKDQIDEIKTIIAKEFDSRQHNVYHAPAADIKEDRDVKVYTGASRVDMEMLPLLDHILDVISNIANRYTEDEPYQIIPHGAMYAEYTGQYANPVLMPHHDGGGCDFMIDYQLDSSLTWGIGMDETVYELNDNEALTLYPLTYLHYRPIKRFKKDDYLKMIFFRFTKLSNPKIEIPKDTQDKIARVQNIYDTFYDKIDKGNN
jgi:hypothetical protein